MAEPGEDPETEIEAVSDQGGAEATALALGRAGRGSGSKAMDAEAAAYLRDQRALIGDQRHHLKVQLKHLGLKYFSERLRVGLQIFVAIGAGALLLFVASLIWQAATDKGLVIEAFHVPPDLAQRGLTGEVLAGQLEDRLSTLQAATESSRAPASYSNDWGHEIKVEIPETGVSISELQRYLRQWLGHETRVGGEIFHANDGLRLTVRVGGDPGDSASGPESDLDGLLKRGAEALFARTQPYRYAVYLEENGHEVEAKAVYQRLEAEGPQSERPWALMGLARIEREPRAAIALYRRALASGPNIALTWANYSGQLAAIGDDQGAQDAAAQTLKLLQASDLGGLSGRSAPVVALQLKAGLGESLGDYGEAVTEQDEILKLPSFYGSRETAAYALAQDLASAHDVIDAGQAATGTEHDADVARNLSKWGGVAFPHYLIAVDREDWAAALGELKGVEPALIQQQTSQGAAIRALIWPREAEALAHLGRFPEALRLAASTPADAYEAVRERGVVAALAGRPAEADHWFADAVRRGPRLPMAYLNWGQALLGRGQPDAAIAKFETAHRLGPHFADPLELWGEALMKKGDFAGAAAKFEAAGKLAPHWRRNQLLLDKARAHG